MPAYAVAEVPPFPDEGDDYYPTLLAGGWAGSGGPSHDSAALLDDGRMIYQYGSGNNVMQAYYPSWEDFGAANNATATTPYSISAHLGGTQTPFSTVFRMADGGLYMSIAYGRAGDSRTEMWSSPSGTGESAPGTADWVLRSAIEVADGYPGFGGDGEFAESVSIGRPILFGGLWVLPGPWAQFAGVLSARVYLAAIWTSAAGADGPWTRRHSATYPSSGTGARGQARQIALHDDGKLYWGSSGNVDAAHCAYSSDGVSWTTFNVGGNSTVADPLFSVDGVMYRYYSTSFPGSWPDTSFGWRIMATTGSPTAAAPPSSLILDLDRPTPSILITHEYAVEGPGGVYAIINRGIILAILGGVFWPVLNGPRWPSGGSAWLT